MDKPLLISKGYDPLQVNLMEEVCILVNDKDNVVGSASKYICHLNENIQQGMLHRAFSVFLFTQNGELLLQQRSKEKITFPLLFTNTCCSHPLAIPEEMEVGTDASMSHVGIRRAAQRKLYHELGISPSTYALSDFQFLTRIRYQACSDAQWGEHEIDYILFLRLDPVLSVNPNEVKSVRYVTRAELQALLEKEKDSGEIQFTPWFKLIADGLLFDWWDHLDHLTPFINHADIHTLGNLQQ